MMKVTSATNFSKTLIFVVDSHCLAPLHHALECKKPLGIKTFLGTTMAKESVEVLNDKKEVALHREC